jgi:hypothetical protein
VRELRRPIGYCNPYFDGFEAITDIGRAADLVDSFDFPPLDIRQVAVSLAAERGVIDEVLVGARATGRARPGRRVPVRVRLQRRGGGSRTVTVRVKVPRDVRPGQRTLVLSGNGFRPSFDLIIELIESELAGARRRAGPQARSAQSGPRTVRRLARRVAALRRPLGIVARFRRREPQVVLRSNEIRFDGRVRLRLRVSGARR